MMQQQVIQKDMKDLLTTKVFVILDEELLSIVKNGNGNPLVFNTHEAANNWAASNLPLWNVIEVSFKHDWIQHTANDHFFAL